MTICRGALMFPALPEKPLSGWNGHQPELAATVLCREPISEELHKLRGRGCHILVSVVKGDVTVCYETKALSSLRKRCSELRTSLFCVFAFGVAN